MASEQVIEEVAQNLEEAASFTRRLNTRGLGFLGVGLVVGGAVGFYYGKKWMQPKPIGKPTKK